MKKLLLSLLIIMTSTKAYASDLLGNSLKNLGIMSSVNKPGVVEDQLGGYFTGGSIHTRNKVMDTNLIDLQLPSLKMGCGGIDLHFGGLGYINTKNLESLVKNIGTSAVSYGAMLTMKTISPLVADVISQLEAMARFINSQNINSCQMGAAIASGVFSKITSSQEYACNAKTVASDTQGNFFGARESCKSTSDLAERNRDEYQGLLGTEFNLVWHALKKLSPGMAISKIEDLMSLSGTLISKPNGEGGIQLSHKNSLIKDSKLLEAKLYGTTGDNVKLYHCRDHVKCVDMGYKNASIKPSDSYMSQIRTLITNIAEKLIREGNGEAVNLTAEEKDLAQTSSISIISIISLELALKGHGVALSAEEYAELVAFDYLIHYLDNMIDEVYKALSTLEYSQMDGEHIKNFKEEIRFIKGYLASERQGAFERMSTLLSVKQRMLQVQNSVRMAFAEYRAN